VIPPKFFIRASDTRDRFPCGFACISVRGGVGGYLLLRTELHAMKAKVLIGKNNDSPRMYRVNKTHHQLSQHFAPALAGFYLSYSVREQMRR